VRDETMVVAAPERCWRPAALEGEGRVWGAALQLYALRSVRNWGVGDFTDLLRVIEWSAAHGAGIVGLNPLHAMFLHNPAHASPYSPSSRVMLNPLYVDVEAVEDYRESEEARRLVRSEAFQRRLAALRAADLVDYPGVAAAKLEVLERLYAHFRARHLARETVRAQRFRDFQAEGGEWLARHALWEALQARFHAADPKVWGPPVWPAEYRDPEGEAVAKFRAEHAERVEFHEYLQWQAELQLARASARCRSLGLAVGLYLDLAVSVDRAGSDVWGHRESYAAEASIGAPPDDFNMQGQDWGLPPLRPDRLRETRYEMFVHTLRENMANAGAVRIDHALGLLRLYWIPPGGGPETGAYVHYQLYELLGILALESHRNQCLVIGEDLGTVPDEVLEALARYGVLSYKLLWFERDRANRFKPPQEYPREALVAVSTHDLPTLAGWWSGADLKLRAELGLFPDDQARREQEATREEDRGRLREALAAAGLQAGDAAERIEAAHAFVAAAPSRVMMVQLEDAFGVAEQVNIPATTDQHPNWRRKLPVALEAFNADERLTRLARRIAELRPAAAASGAVSVAARIPRATYRLQLHKDFTFDDAISVLPYLARLGVSHAYCSPLLRARQGSLHGYDVVDHRSIDPEIGGRAGFERFVAALQSRGMGLIFDVVPNHMGIFDDDNAWWMDVLEHGPASRHADTFDIDWEPANPDLLGKVLVPVLGDQYGLVLERGELKLVFEREAGAFAVRYFEHRLPIDPREYVPILGRAETALASANVSSSARQRLAELREALGKLPPRSGVAPAEIARRARESAELKRNLARLAHMQPAVAAAIESAAAQLTSDVEALHALMEAQAWRLAYWRVASDEINYRRFFDINDLAALRMEKQQVFEATHHFVLSLAAEGKVDGLRIDHPDGLFHPERYFEQLQESYANRAGLKPEPPPDGRPPRPLYVVIEKITARHEHVPEKWAVHGTTGYRFAAVVNGLYVDSAARGRFERIWRAFSGEEDDFEELAYQGKRAILRGALSAELTVLATALLRIARADRRTRDYTLNTLRQALGEVAACMPVYRTYIAGRASAQDRRYIDWAVERARRRGRAADLTIFDFVHRALLGRAPPGASRKLAARTLRFAMKFQQFTSPVAAKGVEDTAFYRYHRLASLNEVGGDPDMFGFPVRAFHGASADRAARWPHTMLATSTHDNKRSEDVRQRINVLSEMPAAWRLALRRWSALNRGHRTNLEGKPAPSASDEYLLYQTLLGSLPTGPLEDDALATYRGRIDAYMQKAAREAKQATSWISPNEAYEQALSVFIGALLGRAHPNPFLEDLRALANTLAWFGALNSVSAVLVKFASPGVPDTYQGNELIDLSLVDPDNRRPVDYTQRRRLLAELEDGMQRAGFVSSLANTPLDGRAKLLATWTMLTLRRGRPELFEGYEGLEASGARAAHVVAFARGSEKSRLVMLTGRLFLKLLGEPGKLPLGESTWQDTAVKSPLPEGTRLTNVLTGEGIEVRGGRIALAEAFARFPGAALVTG
jgi:(1->4)-alpha-D-glucan 1-alpha-D-glucosylmutase